MGVPVYHCAKDVLQNLEWPQLSTRRQQSPRITIYKRLNNCMEADFELIPKNKINRYFTYGNFNTHKAKVKTE